jgi:Ca2+/Na+ antiporter
MAGMSGDVLMGVLFGGLLLLIGAVGTFHSAKSTRGPRERVFATRSNVIAWMAIFAFFMAVYFLPEPHNYLVVILYFLAFPFIVYRVCSRRLLIRRMEAIHAAGHKA